MNYRKKVKLGSLLVSKNVISNEQLDSALKEQRQRGLMLGETIVALGFASQSQINEALCQPSHQSDRQVPLHAGNTR